MGIVRLLLAAVCGIPFFSSLGWADDAAPTRIGRVAALTGAVQYHPPAGDWSSALVNEPVAMGVGIRAPRDATAELRLAGDRVVLAGAGEVKFLRLDGDVLEIALLQGRLGVRLDPGMTTARTVEIDLPSGGVWLAAPGEYDIVAGDSQSPARIQVFAGKAEFGGGLTDSNLAAAAPDAFDAAWRNPAAQRAAPARLSLTLAGAETLAANGSWETDDTVGDAWYPKSLPEGWAPYRDGRWRYLAPWGWTWIDAAEWGFAPSHYGGWERVNGRWAWVPGPRGDDPAYSPARVAFIGTEGIGLSRPGNDGPAVAWFPLASGEETGDGHFRDRRAASVVPRAVFAGGQPVQAALLDLPERRLDDAPVIAGGLGIPPVGDGGTGFVAAAVAPQTVPERVVLVPLDKPVARPTILAMVRQAFVARVKDVLSHAVRKRLPSAAAAALHRGSSAAPSTIAPHSTHNRRHLAAARGGAY